jgi:hypothetical protein
MTIWIDEETNKRVNIQRPYKGFSRLDTPEIRATAKVVEIADDVAPQDAQDNPEHYIRNEDWTATQRPYMTWERRSQGIIDKQDNDKVWQKISQLESGQMLPRAVREVFLELPGASGKGWHAKVKKLDDDVATLRAQLKVIV